MKWLFKWAFRLVFLVVALVVILLLSLDSIFQALVERRIRAQTGMDVQIGKFSVGLLSPVVNIRELRLYNTAEFGGTPFLDVREVHLEYNRSALLGRKFRVLLMRLDLAELNVVKNDAGRTNVVIGAAPAAPGRTTPATNAPYGSIDLLNLSVGKVKFVDLKDPSRSRELRPDMQNQIFRNVKLPDDFGGILSWIWFRSGGGFKFSGVDGRISTRSAVFSLSSPFGGEGRGEEASCFGLRSPHPNPLPAWAGRGSRSQCHAAPDGIYAKEFAWQGTVKI